MGKVTQGHTAQSRRQFAGRNQSTGIWCHRTGLRACSQAHGLRNPSQGARARTVYRRRRALPLSHLHRELRVRKGMAATNMLGLWRARSPVSPQHWDPPDISTYPGGRQALGVWTLGGPSYQAWPNLPLPLLAENTGPHRWSVWEVPPTLKLSNTLNL